MGRLFRFVVSGSSVAELKDNMERALDELNGEQITTNSVAQPAPRLETFSNEDIAAAYTPPAPQAVAQPTGVDSMGLPWDERIHSSNMAKTKDGSWRTRRGVEPAYVKQIEHELIAKIKAGGAAEAPTFQAPPVVHAPIHTPAAPVAPSPVAPAAPTMVPPLQFSPPVTPAPSMGNVSLPPQALTVPAAAALPPTVQSIAPSIATPVAPPVTSAHTLETFIAQFVPTLAALVNQGKLTPEYVAALKNYFKLEQIYDANDEQKASMFDAFCQGGILTKVG